MAISDRNLGWIALVLGFSGLTYLFVRLMIIPLLPLNSDNLFKLRPPTEILVFCAACGLVFVGSLSLYTLYILHRSKVSLKNVDSNFKGIRRK